MREGTKTKGWLERIGTAFGIAAVVLMTGGCTVPSPEITNNSGEDPLRLGPPLCRSLLRGDNDNAATLLNHGAPLNFRNDPDGWSPLIYAIYYDNSCGWQMLLNSGADVNLADFNGRTPLMHAAIQGDDCLVQQLLNLGANVQAQDKDRRTALDYAVLYDNTCSAAILMKATPKVRVEVIVAETE